MNINNVKSLRAIIEKYGEETDVTINISVKTIKDFAKEEVKIALDNFISLGDIDKDFNQI